MDMIVRYATTLKAVEKFRSRDMNFAEFSGWMRSASSGLAYDLSYDGDFNRDVDNWLEYIEYLYPEEKWYELGCSLGAFFVYAITTGMSPLELPLLDIIVENHLKKIR